MTRSKVYSSFRYLALIIAVVLMTTSAQAQEFPVGLEAITPAEGQPGQELEVTLFGWGFVDATEVQLFIGEMEIMDSWVESDEQMGAILFIPEDSPPGPRDVEVIAIFGPNEAFPIILSSGFTVLEGERLPTEESPPPEPPTPDEFNGDPDQRDGDSDGWDFLPFLWFAGLVVIGGTAVLSLTLVWRRSVLRQNWQSEATESDLPETCQEGAHFVRREKPKIKPGRWKVTSLKTTVYDAASRTTDAVHQAPAEQVKNLDKAARQRLLQGMSESLQEQLQQISEDLVLSILAWQSGSKTRKDIYLQTRLEGGQAEQKFTRYRCAGAPGVWVKQVEWTVKLKAIDHFPQAVRGPGEGESQEGYAAFLREQVGEYLLELMEEAGTLF